MGFSCAPPASFTVNSDMQVTATVPVGAKTGQIFITTPVSTAQKRIRLRCGKSRRAMSYAGKQGLWLLQSLLLWAKVREIRPAYL